MPHLGLLFEDHANLKAQIPCALIKIEYFSFSISKSQTNIERHFLYYKGELGQPNPGPQISDCTGINKKIFKKKHL